MVTRIYVVMAKDKPFRLVEASSAAQAIRHCVMKEYSARAAGPKDVAELLMAGTCVEKALTDTESNANNGTNKEE